MWEIVSCSYSFSVAFFPFLNNLWQARCYTDFYKVCFAEKRLVFDVLRCFQWTKNTTFKTSTYFIDFWMMNVKMLLCLLRKRKRSVMRSYRILCCFSLRLGQMLIWGWFSGNRKQNNELVLWVFLVTWKQEKPTFIIRCPLAGYFTSVAVCPTSEVFTSLLSDFQSSLMLLSWTVYWEYPSKFVNAIILTCRKMLHYEFLFHYWIFPKVSC